MPTIKQPQLPTDLTRWGLNHTGDGQKPNQKIVEGVSTFVLTYFDKTRAINSKRNSYGLKNIAEHHIGHYVSNGELIAAMIECGYKFEREPGDSPNCRFNVCEKSVRVADTRK